MRALLIDDQPDFYESICPILSESGFRTNYAHDLATAETNVTAAVFDLVLTDLQMPPGDWGGLEVIKKVRAIDPTVPLFVVSGKGSLAECIHAMRLGADDYIRKEIFAAEFNERVKPRFNRPYAIEHFPSLVAYLFRVFEEEQQPFAKARRLIDVYENTIRLVSLMILAEQSQFSGIQTSTLLEQF